MASPSQLTFVDGGRLVGRDPRSGRETTVDDAVAEMDALGIATAVVGSSRSLHQDASAGNAEAIAWAAASGGRFVPMGIVQPVLYGRSPLERVRAAVDAGALVITVYGSPFLRPGEWRSPAVRAIGEAASEAGVPLQAVVASSVELADVADAWSRVDVPVLVRWTAGHRYQALGTELATADQHPGFVFDVSTACSAGAVELLVSRVGAHRLFVATSSPDFLAACAVGIVRAADLDDDARFAVSSGTLAGIFGLHVDKGVLADDELDELRARPKVDSHWHHDHWNLDEPGIDVAAQTRLVDDHAIERAVTSSVEALTYDMEAGNRSTDAWCAANPRWAGLVVVDPYRPDESRRELLRAASLDHIVGAKTIQDTYGLTLDDARYEPILDAIAETDLPLLCHLPGVGRAATAHPEITFVAAHGNWGRAARLADVPNVMFDFATGHADAVETDLGRFIDLVGFHRVLFGSDAPLISPTWSLAKLVGLRLSTDAAAAILGGNARRLYTRLG